jgi:hypothetical protein
MVCIFQNGMYFPAWYFLAWYVLSSMICIFQHDMYFPAWYVLSTLCIRIVPLHLDWVAQTLHNHLLSVHLRRQ